MIENSRIIQDFLNRYEPKMTEQTKSILKPFLQVVCFPKKQTLIRENQISRWVYFIVQGGARSYYLQNGLEVHTWFAFENEVVGSLRNYCDLPSRDTIELLEASTLIAFDVQGIRNLAKVHIEVSHFIHSTILEYALYMEDKLYHTHLRSAKERFDALIIYEPEIFQRVPLTYIASFLGISRETLSRLRSK